MTIERGTMQPNPIFYSVRVDATVRGAAPNGRKTARAVDFPHMLHAENFSAVAPQGCTERRRASPLTRQLSSGAMS